MSVKIYSILLIIAGVLIASLNFFIVDFKYVFKDPFRTFAWVYCCIFCSMAAITAGVYLWLKKS